jgi:hypothetical protein
MRFEAVRRDREEEWPKLRLPRSPNGKQHEGEHSHAENDSCDPGNFDVESPSCCHALSLAAVEQQR